MSAKEPDWDLKRCMRCAAWIPRPATACAYCGTTSPDVEIDVRPSRRLFGIPRSLTATKVLIGANVVWFLWSFFVQYTWTPQANPLRALLTGEGLDAGMASAGWYSHVGVFGRGEWWRIVAATFLHAGILHIGLNMYSLAVLGLATEEILGASKLLVVYLVCGICSTLGISLWYAVFLGTGPEAIPPLVGASGAVCGVAACLSTFLLRRGSGIGRRWGAHIAVSLVGTLVLGQVLPFVSNTAHVAGILPGVLFGLRLRESFSTRISPSSRRNWFLLASVLVLVAAAALVGALGDSLQHLGAGR